MLRSCINGPDDRAQIYGGQIIPDPPDRSTFNGGGGGGPESLIRPTRIWTAQDRARRSTVNIGFRTPPSVLPLMEGGGPECVIKGVQRSAARKQALRSMAQSSFRTPPTDLLLTKGGGGGPEWNLPSGGPLFIRGIILMAPSPIISCYLTDLRHLWTSPSTFPEMVMSHNCCQSFPPIRSWQAPYYDFYLQSIAATSPVCIPQPPSPTISPSK
jgi:hypothetical protein